MPFVWDMSQVKVSLHKFPPLSTFTVVAVVVVVIVALIELHLFPGESGQDGILKHLPRLHSNMKHLFASVV